MEKESIEKIMENYKNELLKIDGKENSIEINKMNLHIKRLKDEREEVKSEKALYDEYTKKIEEAENELKNYKNKDTQTEINKINYRIQEIEDKKSELDVREYNKQMEEAKKELEDLNRPETPEIKKQKEVDKMNLKDIAIRDLTQANMKIDKSIDEAQLEHLNIMNEIGKFELKYDENHILLNGDERRELFDKSHKIIDKINGLKEAKIKCEEYLAELKQPTKEIETINSILNKSYDSKLRKPIEEDLNVNEKVDNIKKEEKEEKETANSTKIELSDTETVKNVENESSKLSSDKAQTEKEEAVEKLNKKISETNDLSKKDGLNAILDTATLSKDEHKKSAAEEYIKRYDEAAKNVIEININPKKSHYNSAKNEMVTYITFDNKKHQKEDATYDFKEDDKERKIKDVLKNVYKDDKNFEIEEELKKYKKADPYIVELLKNNKSKLERYVNLLNGVELEKNNEEDELNIIYDIRGISKVENITDKAKAEIKDLAFNHRKIAKIKSNIFQKIEFAFRGFKERIEKSKVQKMLDKGITTESTKEGIEDETKNQIQKMIEEKHENKFKNSIKLTPEQRAKMQNDEFLKMTENYKENNKVNDKEIEE